MKKCGSALIFVIPFFAYLVVCCHRANTQFPQSEKNGMVPLLEI